MKKKPDLFILLVNLICVLSLFLNDSSFFHILCGFLLIYFLPGYSLVRLVFRSGEIDFYEEICAGFGLSVAFSCISFLWSYFVFPKVSLPVMGVILSSLSILFSFLCLFRKEKNRKASVPNWEFFLIICILAVAAYFRFMHLGYSDFQGDEAHYSLKPAIEALRGDKDALITMEKPPAATILPAIQYLFFHNFNESAVRLPFAFYGLLAVLVMYLLGRDLFNSRIGLMAASFAGLNGFFIVFSRLAQYQPIVVFSILLALLFMNKFLKASDTRQMTKHLLLGSFFSGFAVFTHYDGFFVLPVIGLIFLYKWFMEEMKNPVILMISAAALFCVVTLPFYIPFILHPNFIHTVRFYKGERFRSFWNFHWPTLRDGGALYNSKDYVWSVLILSGLSVFRKWKSESWILLFWFLPPFIFLMVICSKPNTHIYNFFIPMCILGALGIDNLLRWTTRNIQSSRILYAVRIAFLLSGGILAFSTGHRVNKLFIRHTPEFLWSRPFDSVPHYGIFGFPYHRGWKTAGFLFKTGKLNGSYNSNEKSKITGFYLNQYPEKKFKYFIAVQNPQTWDQNPAIPEGFSPVYRIFSQNELVMTIYEKGGTLCTDLSSEKYDSSFNSINAASENL